MTTCPQCLAAQRDLALAHINHIKETPMPLTWTPDDRTDTLLAIRDRVKAAQDAGVEMERMTVEIDVNGGTVHTALPEVRESSMFCGVFCLFGSSEAPRPDLTRVEWTPPAEPEPVALNEKPDPVARVGLFRHPWTKGSDVCTECGDTYHEHLWLDAGDHGHTICPKNLPTPTPPAEPNPITDDMIEAMTEPIRDWIDSARSLTQSSSVPLGVPVMTHIDGLLRDTRRDLNTALDALEVVLGLWPDRDPCDSCAHTDCEVRNSIAAALGVGESDD